ncbi:hypothetical protein IU477_30685, partial [Nocardia cyriacigeorgica]|nr:hypothetical protein [Nocardia cyriacigeorgica]
SSSSSSSKSLLYEAPLGYSIEDIRPAGGIKKFRSAAYSNVSLKLIICFPFGILVCYWLSNFLLCLFVQCVRKPS